MSGIPRSTPLANLDQVIRLREGIFLTTLKELAQRAANSHRVPWSTTPRGHSFDLDFHTIPFHGEDALIEKHYVSKRSRRQKGILAFLAQDAETRVFCYANGELRKDQQNDEVLRFVRFWKERTGRHPEELIFDSKLTTHANLDELNRLGIQFITLRGAPRGWCGRSTRRLNRHGDRSS